MNKIFFSIISILYSILASSQTPKFESAKRIGGDSASQTIANSVAVDAFGNIYTTGFFNGTIDFDPGAAIYNLSASTNYNEIFVLKTDATGNFIWAKQMGGAGDDVSNCIKLDASGNIFTTGYFSGSADFDPGAGTFNLISNGINDIFISKLDAWGNFIWAKGTGEIGYDGGYSLSLDAIGNAYVTGNLISNKPGTGNIFIFKLNPFGNFVWAKKMGGSGDDGMGTYISVDEGSGSIIITGRFYLTADFDPDSTTCYLNSSGGEDIFISKFDFNGNFIWAKKMGGIGNDNGYSITDKSGNIYITGSFNETVDFDPGVGIFNLKALGLNGGADIFISKLDESGNFIWAKRMGGNFDDEALAMTKDAWDNIYIAGIFQDTADFNPDATNFNLISHGNCDIFILKVNSLGNFVWAKNMGGKSDDICNSIALSPIGNIFTTGWFYGTSDFNPETDEFNLTSSSFYDMFIHKMSQQNKSLMDNNFIIYPNPNNGIFKIAILKPTGKTNVKIYNDIGALVCEQACDEEINTIDLSNQADGLYIVKIAPIASGKTDFIATQKIVKQ